MNELVKRFGRLATPEDHERTVALLEALMSDDNEAHAAARKQHVQDAYCFTDYCRALLGYAGAQPDAAAMNARGVNAGGVNAP